MDNKINFTGAFLIKNPPHVATQELVNQAGRHKQIFENFDNTSDMFYIVRDGRNKVMAKYIADHNLDFIFFPYINTKSGLDPLYPEKALEVVQKQRYFITKASKLLKMFGLAPEQPTLNLNIKGITHALGLNNNDLNIRSKNGITYAFTKDDKHVFKASPTNRYGENYVYFNKGKYSERYLIHGNKIVLKYPDNAKYFDKNFDNCIAQAIYYEV